MVGLSQSWDSKWEREEIWDTVVRDAWSEGVGARAQYVGSTPWVPPTHRLGKSPKPSEQIILSHVPDP